MVAALIKVNFACFIPFLPDIFIIYTKYDRVNKPTTLAIGLSDKGRTPLAN
ncbi:hypothetical protein TUM4438_34030 [Shewanella sairae]|uniref:Uncharacterized protein n=1 Tax=Shewanella sairae TaxID=190310 RepID=A0ABQ4PMZ1_9GAMM|nr:hypothetical protein TUM4438_34030 [Shewanella sairae]